MGHGPATGHELWEEMRPPPVSGPGRSACSFMGTTSAEGPSSPLAGLSRPPTASMSKSLNHGVPLTLLAVHRWGHYRKGLMHCALSSYKKLQERLGYPQDLNHLSFFLHQYKSLRKRVSPKSDPNKRAQFSNILDTPSCLGKLFKKHINIRF